MPSKYTKRPKAPEKTPALFPELEQPPEGWELLIDDEAKAARFQFTGERIVHDRERYEAIMQAIALGMPTELIRKAFHCHHKIVATIALREKPAIDDLKKNLGTEMLVVARWSVRSYFEDLMAGAVDPKTKAIAAGIFAQNGLVLSGQPSAILAVEDRRELTPEAVNGFWERAKRINDAVVTDAGSAAEEGKGQ